MSYAGDDGARNTSDGAGQPGGCGVGKKGSSGGAAGRQAMAAWERQVVEAWGKHAIMAAHDKFEALVQNGGGTGKVGRRRNLRLCHCIIYDSVECHR